MHDAAVRILERFNRKAALLNERRFLAAARNGAGIRSIRGELGKGAVIDHDLPDQEDLHSYLLTLRLFDQAKDGLALDAVAQLIASLPVAQALKDEARSIAGELRRFLGQPTKLVLNGHNPLRRELFDTMLYGGHAHANEDKEARFLAWTSDEFIRILTEAEFVDVLGGFTQAVFWMRQVNLQVLEELQSTTGLAS